MESYGELLGRLGERARSVRILREMRLVELAGRAGVGISTAHRFERTGRASIENVLRIATVLGARGGFERLFEAPPFVSIDDALSRDARVARRRVRARKKAEPSKQAPVQSKRRRKRR